MKKIGLLFSFSVIALASNAQYTLTGTSYTQNFDGLTTSGLPTGWAVYNSATASALGTLDLTYGNSTTWGSYYDTLGCASSVFGHGFKNSASANVSSNATATCAVQQACTDRCLAVRQASNTTYPGFDPGPSFAFEVANTTGMYNFNLTFKLQSLDQLCPRTTTWTLDYGIGASPSAFTAVTPTGTMTTGGSHFANNTVTASFPAAVSNQSQPVWFRISTLSASTGSGSRTTTGIDDFNLTWTTTVSSVSEISSNPQTGITVLGMPTNNEINLAFSTEEEGNYNLNIYDLTGRVVYSTNFDATIGGNTTKISGLNLTNGMYIVKMNNSNSSAVAKVMIF